MHISNVGWESTDAVKWCRLPAAITETRRSRPVWVLLNANKLLDRDTWAITEPHYRFAGDIILTWGGLHIDSPEAFNKQLAKQQPGNRVRWQVLREGELYTFDVTVGAQVPFFDSVLRGRCGGGPRPRHVRGVGGTAARPFRKSTLPSQWALPATPRPLPHGSRGPLRRAWQTGAVLSRGCPAPTP